MLSRYVIPFNSSSYKSEYLPLFHAKISKLAPLYIFMWGIRNNKIFRILFLSYLFGIDKAHPATVETKLKILIIIEPFLREEIVV